MARCLLSLAMMASLLVSPMLLAANKVVDLTISYKTVHFAGKPRRAVSFNNQIPGPVLHFREGDEVTINVHNHLDEEAAVHWHGLLVPWQMDGVLGVTQRGIQPGQSFRYHFKVRQSGSYWYHSHAGLQEQEGLYGAITIDPVKPPPFRYTNDFSIVLSDWTNTGAEQVMSNLKKTGDYYSPNFPLQPSLMKFIHDYSKGDAAERSALMKDYMGMQKTRMGIYDISDVAYDAFLMNGRTQYDPWTGRVHVGDIVRLRFVGAGAATIFHVKIPGTTMKMVQVDGNDVKPYYVNDFNIAPGETYDVLVTIEKDKPYIIYAASLDTVGAAYGALITKPQQSVAYESVKPFPEPLPVTRQMMKFMMPSSMHSEHGKSMSMSMSTEPSIIGDHFMPAQTAKGVMTTPGTQYEPIKAAVKTNDPHKPIKDVIRMELFGYMQRYIWLINGLPQYRAKPLVLEPGKRYRLIFKNTSMMHHPMHIHGHWFILRKGLGDHDPLMHTIDVPPGATVVADVDTDASGQWYYHCHFLYHMMTGMSRVVRYSTLIDIVQDDSKPERVIKKTPYHNRPIVRVDEVRSIPSSIINYPEGQQSMIWLASFLEVGADPFHSVQTLTFKGLYGHDYHKLELLTKDAELNRGTVDNADMDIFYWHLISQYWAVKGGVNYFYRPAFVPYWQVGGGIEGLMPFFIDTDARAYYYQGSFKGDIELSRDTQITNNFLMRLGVRSIFASKTVNRAQIGSGLNQMRYVVRPFYRLVPGINLFTEFEHDVNYGQFKVFQGGENVEDTLSFGVSMIL